MWRQRGDHFIGYEELAETEETTRVECAAKRLLDEVKVFFFVGHLRTVFLLDTYALCSWVRNVFFFAGRNENGEVPENVLRPN